MTEVNWVEILKRPFPEDSISVKVQSVSKDRTKALLVCYLQHTDVYNRIEEVDPGWRCEPIKEYREGDMYYVTMGMTVENITRYNVGEGNDPKGAYSDALKRVAMLFGVGRYLYDMELVWVPYNESTDKYKRWTYADFKKHAKESPVVSSPTSIRPSQPDSIAGASLAGDHEITWGMHINKKIRELNDNDLRKTLDWVNSLKDKHPKQAKTAEMISQYLSLE